MIRISRRWYPQCVRHAKTSCTWLCTAAITPFRAEKRKAANNAAAEKMSELNQGQEEIPASGLCCYAYDKNVRRTYFSELRIAHAAGCRAPAKNHILKNKIIYHIDNITKT